MSLGGRLTSLVFTHAYEHVSGVNDIIMLSSKDARKAQNGIY